MIIFNLSWDLTSTEPFVKKETSYSLHSTAIIVGDEMIIPPFASIFQEESIESGKNYSIMKQRKEERKEGRMERVTNKT